MIILEGPRNTGKTYLLDQYLKAFPNNFLTHKFPFFKYYEELKIDNKQEATAFSYGKDLALLSLAKDNFLPNNVILDRGFVSSIVFSKLFRNEKEERLIEYANIIKDIPNIQLDIVYITPSEADRSLKDIPQVRSKDVKEMALLTSEEVLPSQYDLWYGWALELFKNRPNIKIHRFTNHFNEGSVSEFIELINAIKRTY